MIDRLTTFCILRVYSLQLSIMKVYIDRVMFALPIIIYTYMCVFVYIYTYIYAKEMVKCHNTPNSS